MCRGYHLNYKLCHRSSTQPAAPASPPTAPPPPPMPPHLLRRDAHSGEQEGGQHAPALESIRAGKLLGVAAEHLPPQPRAQRLQQLRGGRAGQGRGAEASWFTQGAGQGWGVSWCWCGGESKAGSAGRPCQEDQTGGKMTAGSDGQTWVQGRAGQPHTHLQLGQHISLQGQRLHAAVCCLQRLQGALRPGPRLPPLTQVVLRGQWPVGRGWQDG